MIRELIDKLKAKKRQLQKYGINNDIAEIIPIEEVKDINIIISNQDNKIKIEISDYISIGNFVKKMKSSDEYSVLDLLGNCVLWNVNKQKKFCFLCNPK